MVCAPITIPKHVCLKLDQHRSPTITCVSPTSHRVTSLMCLCDLRMQTHAIEEVRYAPPIKISCNSAQVIIEVNCSKIVSIDAGPIVKSKVEIEAISWAAVRLGLSVEPIPITRFEPNHLNSAFVFKIISKLIIDIIELHYTAVTQTNTTGITGATSTP